MFILGVVAAQAKTRAADGTVSETDNLFPYTGAEEQLVVPAGITRARLRLWGGAGAGGAYSTGEWGGNGGFTDISIDVEEGDVLTIQTGQGGRFNGNGINNPGGWPDGGTGSYGDATGGGGGGSSRVFRNSDLVAIAGGGAGACGYLGNGGGGGGTNGGNGTAGGAVGATQSAGGTSGGGGDAGTGPVTFATRNTQRGGNGGPQGVSTGTDGGAGGGGYYGGAGGGGDARAGSGGSGFVLPEGDTNLFLTGTNGSTTGGANTDDSMFQPFYPGSPIASGSEGNSGSAGGDGYVMISLRINDEADAQPSDAEVIAEWGASDIHAIYSLRRTIPTYTGPLVCAKRASDNAYRYFYPAEDGWIDVAEVETWAAGSDVLVSLWCDQSSYGNHALGTAQLPHLALAGEVDIKGGRPAIRFGGSDYTVEKYLRIPFNMWDTPHTFTFAGARMSNSAVNLTQYGALISTGLSSNAISYGYNGAPSVPSLMRNGNSDHTTGTTTALTTGVVNSFVASGAYAGGTFSVVPYVNGALSSTLSLNYSTTTLDRTVTILGRAESVADHFGGLLHEVVITLDAMTDPERESVEAVMAAFYEGGIAA